MRLALATLSFPADPASSVRAVCEALTDATADGVDLVCFPECFVPGYRALGAPVPEVDADWLADAHATIAEAAGRTGVAVVVGTERYVGQERRITALVVDGDGRPLGWQDKVQLDPTEDSLYAPGETRMVFDLGDVPVGVVICHEGWRYPETVRTLVRAGARLLLHPQFAPAADETVPAVFADPSGSFHESAARVRAAENEVWFATVNCAEAAAPIGSAVVAPDGTVAAAQPRGEAGLLVVDLDLSLATGRYADRVRPAATCA